MALFHLNPIFCGIAEISVSILCHFLQVRPGSILGYSGIEKFVLKRPNVSTDGVQLQVYEIGWKYVEEDQKTNK